MPRGSPRSLGVPILRIVQADERRVKVRITKLGVGVVINMRSDWREGDVVDAPLQDARMFIREGWAELLEEEPPVPEPEFGPIQE